MSYTSIDAASDGESRSSSSERSKPAESVRPVSELVHLADSESSAVEQPTSLDIPVALGQALERAVTHSSPVGETPMVEVEREGSLSEFERKLLAFERQWWQFPGAKEAAIRSNFGISPNRYYQAINTLMETHRALAYDPMLVKRWRRRRAERRKAQCARQLGIRLKER